MLFRHFVAHAFLQIRASRPDAVVVVPTTCTSPRSCRCLRDVLMCWSLALGARLTYMRLRYASHSSGSVMADSSNSFSTTVLTDTVVDVAMDAAARCDVIGSPVLACIICFSKPLGLLHRSKVRLEHL